MLARIVRLAVSRGALKGSRFWMGVWAAAGAVRLLRRFAAREPKVVYCEKLRPGQRLEITHLPRRRT